MKKSVEQLAARFNTKPDVIETALEEDGSFDGVFEAFDKDNHIFTSAELSKKLDNFAKDAIDKLGADGQQLPSNIYNLAKGNAFEKKEKSWAKKHGITQWDDIDDLQEKIIVQIEAKSGKADDEKDTEIVRLKKLVLDTEKEKTDAVDTARSEFHEELTQRDVTATLNSIQIDEEGEKLENQKSILNAVVKGEFTFEYIDGKTVPFKDKEMLKNKVGDPMSLEEVLNPFAEKYVNVKSVPEGGRGGSSTAETNTGIKGIKTSDDFYEYAEKEGIEEGTEKYLDLMVKFKTEHPEINKRATIIWLINIRFFMAISPGKQ